MEIVSVAILRKALAAFCEGGARVRAFLWALWVARGSVTSLIVGLALFWHAPQVHDLFIETSATRLSTPAFIAVFLLIGIMFWMVPIYVNTAIALHDGDDAQIHSSWLPGLLAVSCLAIVTAAIYFARAHLATNALLDTSDLPRIFRSAIELRNSYITTEAAGLLSVLIAASLTSTVVVCGLWRASFIHSWPSRQDNRRLRAFAATFGIVGFAVLLAFQSTIVVDNVGISIPRVAYLFIALGMIAAVLTPVTMISRRIGQPVTLYLAAAIFALGAITEPRYNVRYRASLPTAEAGRPSLKEMLVVWMRSNGCLEPSTACPQPIIVAASGGASRAAFFTASVLADLEESSAHSQNSRLFSRQLFAISAVSGSSLAAAAFSTAIRADPDALRKADPCKHEQNWFQCHSSYRRDTSLVVTKTALRMFNKKEGLRNSLQAFLSADFITPTIVALTSRDFINLGENRSDALERRFEQKSAQLFLNDAMRTSFVGTLPTADIWRPLLVFNGTSVNSGRRIILSGFAQADLGRSVFADAYDFYALACGPESAVNVSCRCDVPVRGEDARCDLPLSGGVMVSARFPVISPAGNLVDYRGRLVDRVVDGGYFENYGVVTAVELAQVVRKLGASLGKDIQPFLLQISNDPEAFLKACSDAVPGGSNMVGTGERLGAPLDPPLQVDRTFWLGWLRDPLATVLNTRSARGYHATALAESELSTVRGGSYAHMWVCPQRIIGGRNEQHLVSYKQLSMSWWLSMPVQQYLNQQVNASHNKPALARVHKVLSLPDIQK